MSGAIRRFFVREDGMSKLFKTLLLLLVLVAAAAGLYALSRSGKGDGDHEARHGREGLDHREGPGGRSDPAASEVLDQVEDLGNRQALHGQRRRPRQARRPAARDRAGPDAAGADRRGSAARLDEGVARPGQGRLRPRPAAGERRRAAEVRPRRQARSLRARQGRRRPGRAEPRPDAQRPHHDRDDQHGIDHPGARRRNRPLALRQPRGSGRSADLLPAGHRARRDRRHERSDLQGHGGRDRRRQASRRA